MAKFQNKALQNYMQNERCKMLVNYAKARSYTKTAETVPAAPSAAELPGIRSASQLDACFQWNYGGWEQNHERKTFSIGSWVNRKTLRLEP